MKQFEITDLPVRTAKFIVRKQWVVAGSDDMFVTVHNFNTMEKVKRFEAHSDYIRSIAVHPTLPIVLTSSDDMLIKLWDWDKNWENSQTFEGHTHYVMMVAFNPKDPNTFASASCALPLPPTFHVARARWLSPRGVAWVVSISR